MYPELVSLYSCLVRTVQLVRQVLVDMSTRDSTDAERVLTIDNEVSVYVEAEKDSSCAKGKFLKIYRRNSCPLTKAQLNEE